MSCENTFINYCKPLNEIELNTRGSTCVNDIELILDEVNKIEDELHWVWIKNHIIKLSIVSIKLMVVANLVCAMLMFITIIMFTSNKWN